MNAGSEAAHAAAVRRLFDGVARRDAATVLAAFAPDVVIHEAESLPYGGRYAGNEGLLRHVAAYTQWWDSLQDDAERRLDPAFYVHGDTVLVTWRQRGHREATGETFDAPAVSLYRLRDGRIVESRMFHFDSAAVRRFLLGPSEGGTDRA